MNLLNQVSIKIESDKHIWTEKLSISYFELHSYEIKLAHPPQTCILRKWMHISKCKEAQKID
jgi:hypothetical protein